MTNKEILELAKSCGMDNFTGRTDEDKLSPYWECWEEQLLKFARAIRQDGYSEGYDDGWEQANYNNPLEGIFSSNDD